MRLNIIELVTTEVFCLFFGFFERKNIRRLRGWDETL